MRGIVCYHHHQNNAPQYCLFVWQVILCLFVCFTSKTFFFVCQIKSFSLFRICYHGWFFGNLQSWAELSRQVCPLFNWTKSDNIFLPPSRLGTDFCPKSEKNYLPSSRLNLALTDFCQFSIPIIFPSSHYFYSWLK